MATYMSYIIQRRVIQPIVKCNALKTINILLNFNRHCSSSGSVASSKEYLPIINRYIDFDEKLANVEKLQHNLTARGINLDAKEIKDLWEFYKSVRTNKVELESRNNEITKKLQPLFQKEELTVEEQTEFTKLKLQVKVIKQDLKTIKGALVDLNESILGKLFQLPNEVDERTPVQNPVIIKRVNSLNERSDSEKKNHIEIGRRLGLLEYRNPMQYYLCNDAALFELGVLSYAGQIFSEDNMIRVAGADFSRSLLIDGSGLNPEDPADAFIIDNYSDTEKNSSNRMHLVGGASLISFLAMHARQCINPSHLPVAYFSTGRQYTPFRPGFTPIGLFTVCQASAALAFVLVKDAKSQEYHMQFEKLLNTVCKLYDNVCDHYQIVVRPASELRPWEAMRVSFELWSPFSKQYIEVGHISAYGEYFSKRLMIVYQSSKKQFFPSVISGTVLSVPRLLGCLLEQNPDKFIIPQKIMEHMPRNNSSL